jgi:hypothetical protein
MMMILEEETQQDERVKAKVSDVVLGKFGVGYED